MKTFQCQNCKFEVDFRKLPEDYKCPECGVDREFFVEKEKLKIPLFLLFLYSGTLLMIIISGALTISTIYNQNKIPHHKVEVGELSLEIVGQNDTTIRLYNTAPMSDEKAKNLSPFLFKIDNDGTYALNYTLTLEDVPDNELIDIDEIIGKTRIDNSKVKYSIVDTDTNNVIKQGFVSENEILISGKMNARKSNSYALRLWIDKNVGNEGQNKFYAGRLVLHAYEDINDNKED